MRNKTLNSGECIEKHFQLNTLYVTFYNLKTYFNGLPHWGITTKNKSILKERKKNNPHSSL